MRYTGRSSTDHYTPFKEQIDRRDLGFKRSLRKKKRSNYTAEVEFDPKKSGKMKFEDRMRKQVDRYFRKLRKDKREQREKVLRDNSIKNTSHNFASISSIENPNESFSFNSKKPKKNFVNKLKEFDYISHRKETYLPYEYEAIQEDSLPDFINIKLRRKRNRSSDDAKVLEREQYDPSLPFLISNTNHIPTGNHVVEDQRMLRETIRRPDDNSGRQEEYARRSYESDRRSYEGDRRPEEYARRDGGYIRREDGYQRRSAEKEAEPDAVPITPMEDGVEVIKYEEPPGQRIDVREYEQLIKDLTDENEDMKSELKGVKGKYKEAKEKLRDHKKFKELVPNLRHYLQRLEWLLQDCQVNFQSNKSEIKVLKQFVSEGRKIRDEDLGESNIDIDKIIKDINNNLVDNRNITREIDSLFPLESGSPEGVSDFDYNSPKKNKKQLMLRSSKKKVELEEIPEETPEFHKDYHGDEYFNNLIKRFNENLKLVDDKILLLSTSDEPQRRYPKLILENFFDLVSRRYNELIQQNKTSIEESRVLLSNFENEKQENLAHKQKIWDFVRELVQELKTFSDTFDITEPPIEQQLDQSLERGQYDENNVKAYWKKLVGILSEKVTKMKNDYTEMEVKFRSLSEIHALKERELERYRENDLQNQNKIALLLKEKGEMQEKIDILDIEKRHERSLNDSLVGDIKNKNKFETEKAVNTLLKENRDLKEELEKLQGLKYRYGDNHFDSDDNQKKYFRKMNEEQRHHLKWIIEQLGLIIMSKETNLQFNSETRKIIFDLFGEDKAKLIYNYEKLIDMFKTKVKLTEEVYKEKLIRNQIEVKRMKAHLQMLLRFTRAFEGFDATSERSISRIYDLNDIAIPQKSINSFIQELNALFNDNRESIIHDLDLYDFTPTPDNEYRDERTIEEKILGQSLSKKIMKQLSFLNKKLASQEVLNKELAHQVVNLLSPERERYIDILKARERTLSGSQKSKSPSFLHLDTKDKSFRVFGRFEGEIEPKNLGFRFENFGTMEDKDRKFDMEDNEEEEKEFLEYKLESGNANLLEEEVNDDVGFFIPRQRRVTNTTEITTTLLNNDQPGMNYTTGQEIETKQGNEEGFDFLNMVVVQSKSIEENLRRDE